MSFCPNCGTQVDEYAIICPKCRGRINATGKAEDRTVAGKDNPDNIRIQRRHEREEIPSYRPGSQNASGQPNMNDRQSASGQPNMNGRQNASGQPNMNGRQSAAGSQNIPGQQYRPGQQNGPSGPNRNLYNNNQEPNDFNRYIVIAGAVLLLAVLIISGSMFLGIFGKKDGKVASNTDSTSTTTKPKTKTSGDSSDKSDQKDKNDADVQNSQNDQNDQSAQNQKDKNNKTDKNNQQSKNDQKDKNNQQDQNDKNNQQNQNNNKNQQNQNNNQNNNQDKTQESRSQNGPAESEETVGLSKMFYRENHGYAFFDATYYGLKSYDDVEDFCELLGGHLAVINDGGENDYLFSLLSTFFKHTAFFGYSDRSQESNWRWVAGSSDYTNWTTGGDWDLPDNGRDWNGDEDYAEFNYERGKNWLPNDGTWNDAPFMENTNVFICEWEFEPDPQDTSNTEREQRSQAVGSNENNNENKKYDKKDEPKQSTTDDNTTTSKSLEEEQVSRNYLFGQEFTGYVTNLETTDGYDISEIPQECVGYYYYDFDQDGEEELVILELTENQAIMIEMYEVEGDKVVEADRVLIDSDKYDDGFMRERPVSEGEPGFSNAFVYNCGGETRIGFEFSFVELHADGSVHSILSYRYNNNQLTLADASNRSGSALDMELEEGNAYSEQYVAELNRVIAGAMTVQDANSFLNFDTHIIDYMKDVHEFYRAETNIIGTREEAREKYDNWFAGNQERMAFTTIRFSDKGELHEGDGSHYNGAASGTSADDSAQDDADQNNDDSEPQYEEGVTYPDKGERDDVYDEDAEYYGDQENTDSDDSADYSFLDGMWMVNGHRSAGEEPTRLYFEDMTAHYFDESGEWEVPVHAIVKTSYGYFLEMGSESGDQNYGYHWEESMPDTLSVVDTWDPYNMDTYSGTSSYTREE